MQRYCFDRYFIGLHKNDSSWDIITLNYTSYRVVVNNQKQQKYSKVIFIRKENLVLAWSNSSQYDITFIR
jgi:hypothetical protein